MTFSRMMISVASNSPFELEHLDPSVRHQAMFEAMDRIRIAKSPCWIPTKHAARLMAKLEYVFSHPKSVDMPNLLIVGASGNGKSSLKEEFIRRHPASDNIESETISIPIVACQVPATPDLGGFYNELLEAMRCQRNYGRIDSRRNNVEDVLAIIGARALIFDETHNILNGGPQQQRVFLSAIKSLGNKTCIPIVCLGTYETLGLFKKDEQIQRRFAYDELARWRCDAEFRRLVISFERLLPLQRASNLKEQSLCRMLYAMCDGTIGKLARVLAQAATKAIESGEEAITKEILDSIDLEPPSLRNR